MSAQVGQEAKLKTLDQGNLSESCPPADRLDKWGRACGFCRGSQLDFWEFTACPVTAQVASYSTL